MMESSANGAPASAGPDPLLSQRVPRSAMGAPGMDAPAADVYDARYTRGYMDGWSAERKQRIFDLVRGLDLPEVGTALDFGCGNGLLTDVIRRALPPAWQVWGTDISGVAVNNARAWFPQCRFFTAAEGHAGRRFDLVFTHHVLEHVEDLGGTLAELDAMTAERATIVHILPCGNEGSLEHTICRLRSGGIDPERGNRFFYEEPGHLRRLTTAQLSEAYLDRGFRLVGAQYANHHAGAIEWITQSGPSFVFSFMDPSAALDDKAREALSQLRRMILGLWLVRYPAAFVDTRLRTRSRRWWELVLLPVGLLCYPVSKPVDVVVKRWALAEWRDRRSDPSGSEMYLSFRREQAPEGGPIV
jgi:SAM-dependent methyltransferase